jgi:hypothetical protein
MIDPQSKANLERLLAELTTTATRLHEIAESAFCDMEGADMPDFAISEELTGLDDTASAIQRVVAECQKLAAEQ